MSTRFARRRKTASEKSDARTSSRQKQISRFDSSSAFAGFIYDMKAGRYQAGRYRMLDSGTNRYTIKSSRWIVRTDRPEELIAIETEDGKLIVVHYNDLRVDGRSVKKICIKDMYPRGRCFTADDIRCMVVSAISRLLDPGY